VSMECLFNDFDYAVVSPQGEKAVVSRDETSAFLTKHLRAYGGSGKYEGYTVGRLLRNIAFSGKGLVSNPANPRSVILNDVNPFEETQALKLSNSSINMENCNMSDVLKEQVEELKAELVTAKEAAKALETEMTKQKDEEIQSKIEAFEAVVSEKDEAIAEAQAAVEAAEAKLAELQEAIAKKNEELAEALAKIEAHEAEVKAMARRAALVEAGAEEEEVEAILESFAEATDEMFEQVVALKKNAMKKMGVKKDEENPFEKKDEEEGGKPKAEEVEAEEVLETEAEETDEAAEEAEAEILEEVEEEAEAALTDAGDDVVEELRSSASDWLESNVLRSTASINK
jgi:chromosome segregation ATPase